MHSRNRRIGPRGHSGEAVQDLSVRPDFTGRASADLKGSKFCWSSSASWSRAPDTSAFAALRTCLDLLSPASLVNDPRRKSVGRRPARPRKPQYPQLIMSCAILTEKPRDRILPVP